MSRARLTGRGIGVALALICGWPALSRGGELEVSTAPDPLVAGKTKTVRITVRGELPADPVRADVNVGSVSSVQREGDALVFDYAMPAGRHPRRVCLLLWQDAPNGRAQVIRVPLLGRSSIPVRTRRNSTVVVRVGERSFGPVPTGRRGRVRVPVLVPPGVTRANVEVTDKAGLTSSKSVRVRRPRYPQLAAAAIPAQTSSARVRVRVLVATADRDPLEITVAAGDATLAARPLAEGLWEATWEPAERPAPGAHELTVRAAERRAGERTLVVQVLAPKNEQDTPSTVKPPAVVRHPVAAAAPRRWHGVLGIGAGLTSNLGALLAPRLSAEAGVERSSSWGVLGARLTFGVSWASQEITAAAPPASVDATVLLLPFAAGVSYRYPLRHVEPYGLASFVAQLVRTRTGGAGIAERVRHDFAPGFSVAAGASRRLGPGRLFLQAGYLFSRVDEQEITLLAGGLVVDAGYRLSL